MRLDDYADDRPESRQDYIKAVGVGFSQAFSETWKSLAIALVYAVAITFGLSYLSSLDLPVYIAVPLLVGLIVVGCLVTVGLILHQLEGGKGAT
jgi:hypothetical protein